MKEILIFIATIGVIACIVGPLMFFIVRKFHTPLKEIPKDKIEQIKKYGLLHFTNTRDIESIRKKGLLGSKGGYVGEKGLVWFYISNSNVEETIIERFSHFPRSTRKKKNVCLVFYPVPNDKISLMHYRKDDAAVSYSGTFNGEFVEYDFKKNRKEQIISVWQK